VTDVRFVGKKPLAIGAMNAELPPFKNGEHNSESTLTIDRVITPLTLFHTLHKWVRRFLQRFAIFSTGWSHSNLVLVPIVAPG